MFNIKKNIGGKNKTFSGLIQPWGVKATHEKSHYGII